MVDRRKKLIGLVTDYDIREAFARGETISDLRISDIMNPRPTSVYPLGGMAGQTLKLTMLGDAGGPFEQTVKLPDQPVGRFQVFAQKDGVWPLTYPNKPRDPRDDVGKFMRDAATAFAVLALTELEKK